MSYRKALWFGAVSGVLASTLFYSPSHAQSSEAEGLAAQCAALAASDAEDGVLAYVEVGKLVPSMALEPCRLAVEKNPSDMKSRYRLSRVQAAHNDKSEAFESARIAAEGGYGPAMYNLAIMYRDGDGGALDQKKSFEWMLKAAIHDQQTSKPFRSDIYTSLANDFFEGQGVDKNPAEAVRWLTRAAALNNADALASLGYYYQMGIGVAKNNERSFYYTIHAAQAGSCGGALNAGLDYYYGAGVTVDKQSAKQWFMKAKGCPTLSQENVKIAGDMLAKLDKEASSQDLTTGQKLALGVGAAVIGGIFLSNKLRENETAPLYVENACQDTAHFVIRYFDHDWRFASIDLRAGKRSYLLDSTGQKVAHQVEHKFYVYGFVYTLDHRWEGKSEFQYNDHTLYMLEQEPHRDEDGDLYVLASCH